MSKGCLFIVSAPSGAGKTSIIRGALQKLSLIEMSVSYTSRAKRGAEVDGVDYSFIEKDRFKQLIESNFFAEWADVFGNYYGTSLEDTKNKLNSGKDLFLDIDWQGADILKQLDLPIVTVYIMPPSLAVLKDRLFSRNTDMLVDINLRMSEVASEAQNYHKYDYLIVNNVFEDAVADLCSIVRSYRLRTAFQRDLHQDLIKSLTVNNN